MPTRSELEMDAPDAFQKAANAVWAKVGTDDEIQSIIASAFVEFHGDELSQNVDDGIRRIREETELYDKFQARVWLRVIDLLLVGED